MGRSRARLTLVVNRSRRPSQASAVRAAFAVMAADAQRQLKAMGSHYQRPRTTFGAFTQGRSLSEVMGLVPTSPSAHEQKEG